MMEREEDMRNVKSYRLKDSDLDILKYALTACEDMERPDICKATCPVYVPCLELRKKLWNKDVLKDTEYRLERHDLVIR